MQHVETAIIPLELQAMCRITIETAVTHHGRQHAVVEVVVVVVALEVRYFDVRDPLDLIVIATKTRPSQTRT